MGIEIERKFLVNDNIPLGKSPSIHCTQGYIPTSGLTSVRVRVVEDNAFLTIKGETFGAKRSEFEYPIPIKDAQSMLQELCKETTIEKTRYIIEYCGFIWEVDVFHGKNQGLIVAEIELKSEDQQFPIPDWIDKEVTGKPEYYNINLTSHPWSDWK